MHTVFLIRFNLFWDFLHTSIQWQNKLQNRLIYIALHRGAFVDFLLNNCQVYIAENTSMNNINDQRLELQWFFVMLKNIPNGFVY